MLQMCYLKLAETILVLVSPSKELSIHLSKNLTKYEFEVCVSDLLYSQYHQRLLQCRDRVLDNYYQYSMSVPSCLLSHIHILVM